MVAAAALGASSNCPIHMVAIARHMGVEHTLDDWQRLGPEIPLLVRPAAGRTVPGREVPSRRRRARGAEGTAGRRQAARRRDDRHRPHAGGESARRAGRRSRGDPLLRQSDAGGRRLRRDVGQSVRQRGDEDQRHRPGFSHALPVQSRAAERVRGQGDRVRRPGGLPPPHRGSRSRRRRAVGADHPQLRSGRLSRQRRGGEHAAAGRVVEARHR